MPNVIGETVEEAQRILENLGLRGRRHAEANDDTGRGHRLRPGPRARREGRRGLHRRAQGERRRRGDPGARRHRLAGRPGPPAAHRPGLHGRASRRSTTRRPPSARSSTRTRARRPGRPRGIRGQAVRVQGPAAAPVPDVVGRTDRRGLQPARPGRLRGEPDARALGHRARGPGHPHRPCGRHVAAEGQPPSPSSCRAAPPRAPCPRSIGLTEANAINTLNNAGFSPTVVEQDTADPHPERARDRSGPRPATPSPSSGRPSRSPWAKLVARRPTR